MTIFSAAGVLDPMLTSAMGAQNKTKPARVIMNRFFIWLFLLFSLTFNHGLTQGKLP